MEFIRYREEEHFVEVVLSINLFLVVSLYKQESISIELFGG